MFAGVYRENSSIQQTQYGGYIFTCIGDYGVFSIIRTDGNGVLEYRIGYANGEANSISPTHDGFIISGIMGLGPTQPGLVKTDEGGFNCVFGKGLNSTFSDTLIV